MNSIPLRDIESTLVSSAGGLAACASQFFNAIGSKEPLSLAPRRPRAQQRQVRITIAPQAQP